MFLFGDIEMSIVMLDTGKCILEFWAQGECIVALCSISIESGTGAFSFRVR